MKKWKISLEIEVSDSWVEDGFDASKKLELIEELCAEILPFAIQDVEFKIKAKVLSAPKKEELLKLRGYLD